MFEILVQRSLKYSGQLALRISNKLGVRGPLDQLYFAYGANLSEARLRSKHLSVERVGVAEAVDQEIVFNVPCEYVGQGYAGLSPKRGALAPGVLFKTNRASLILLDIFEWVPFSFYQRKKIEVILDGSVVSAWAYVPSHPRDGLKPSLGYLNFVRSSARDHGFSVTSFETSDCVSSQVIDHEFNLWNPGLPRPVARFSKSLTAKHDQLREKLAKRLP